MRGLLEKEIIREGSFVQVHDEDYENVLCVYFAIHI